MSRIHTFEWHKMFKKWLQEREALNKYDWAQRQTSKVSCKGIKYLFEVY